MASTNFLDIGINYLGRRSSSPQLSDMHGAETIWSYHTLPNVCIDEQNIWLMLFSVFKLWGSVIHKTTTGAASYCFPCLLSSISVHPTWIFSKIKLIKLYPRTFIFFFQFDLYATNPLKIMNGLFNFIKTLNNYQVNQ